MKLDISKFLIIGLAGILAISYVFALNYRLYLKTGAVDLAQHFIAGILLGLWWLKLNGNSPAKTTGMSIIGFVLLVSIVWEWFEFLTWKLLPAYSSTLYLSSRSVEDLITDLTADLAGALIVWVLNNRRS